MVIAALSLLAGAGHAGAATYNETAGDTTVFECGPFVEGGVYTLNQSFSATVDCLIIQADNVTVDMNGFNITGDGDSAGDHCVNNSGGYDGTAVHDGGIYQFGAAIYSAGGSGVFTDLNISADSDFGPGSVYGMYLTGDGNQISGIRISKMNQTNAVTAYASGIYLAGNGNVIGSSMISDVYTEMTADGLSLSGSSSNNVSDTVITNVKDDDVQLASASTNNKMLNVSYSSEDVAAGCSLVREWHYRAFVAYPSGYGAVSVGLAAYNASGALIESLTTNGTGWTAIVSLIDYVNASGITQHYSNYTINVTHPGLITGSGEYNVTLTKSNLSDVVSFGSIFSFSGWDTQSVNTNAISVADLDNDGDLDYMAGNYNEPNNVYLNNGTGHFTLSSSSAQSNNTMSIAVADLDNDGDLDYIAGNYNQPNNVYVNNGTGNFTILEASNEGEDTFSVAIADLDNDGDLDYIAGNYDQPNRVYLNNGTGHFTSLETSQQSDYTRTISIADLDNDGDMDYIAGNGPSPKGNDRVYINNGTGHFTLNSSTALQDRTYGLAAADLNNDGSLDFISGNAGPGKNRIYLKDIGGGFVLYENSPFMNTTNCIAAADLDGDGDLDYIAGNTGNNSIHLNGMDDSNYAVILIKGTKPYTSRDAIGTRVAAYLGGKMAGYRQLTAADSSQDGAIQLHFGLAAGGTYYINSTFMSGRMVSCSVTPPVNFIIYENGSSTGGVSCYVVDFPPGIVSMQPQNGNVTISMDVNFTCAVSDDNQLESVTIYIWNGTNDEYYSGTEYITGTANQSSWFVQSMVPDVYMWNCIPTDNASKEFQQPSNYSLRILLRNRLLVKLVINNTDNTVYIPGVGELNSSGLAYQRYSNPPRYYISSHLDDAVSALVFSMQIPRSIEAGSNATANTHHILVEQDMENSRAFLAFTLGSWRVIESRMALIEAGRFLTNILPSFSYGLGNRHSLDLALGYDDIDLQGRLMLRKGTHKVVIENNGTSGGKPVVVISRE